MNTGREFSLGMLFGAIIALCILYGKILLDASLVFIDAHSGIIPLLQVLLVGLGGWFALRRWQVSQLIKTWSELTEKAYDKEDENFAVFTLLFMFVGKAISILQSSVTDDEKKMVLREMLKDIDGISLPKIPMDTKDLRIMHAVNSDGKLDFKTESAVEILKLSIDAKTMLKLCLEVPIDQIKIEALEGIYSRSSVIARKYAQYLNALTNLDRVYVEWLIKRWVGKIDAEHFAKSKKAQEHNTRVDQLKESLRKNLESYESIREN